MILAVLEARAGLRIKAHDVYLNVAGGLKVREPAADLAAAAALVSSLHGAPLPAQAVLFGEIALSEAVRPVGQSEQRLKEAAKLGLTAAVIAGNGGEPAAPSHLRIRLVETVSDLVAWVVGLPTAGKDGGETPAPACDRRVNPPL